MCSWVTIRSILKTNTKFIQDELWTIKSRLMTENRSSYNKWPSGVALCKPLSTGLYTQMLTAIQKWIISRGSEHHIHFGLGRLIQSESSSHWTAASISCDHMQTLDNWPLQVGFIWDQIKGMYLKHTTVGGRHSYKASYLMRKWLVGHHPFSAVIMWLCDWGKVSILYYVMCRFCDTGWNTVCMQKCWSLRHLNVLLMPYSLKCWMEIVRMDTVNVKLEPNPPFGFTGGEVQTAEKQNNSIFISLLVRWAVLLRCLLAKWLRKSDTLII